jgi:hypothetical protein
MCDLHPHSGGARPPRTRAWWTPRRGAPARRLLAVVALCLSGMIGHAEAQEDPDWPCIQRKVPHLAVGQLWAGPPIPEDAAWRDDPEIAGLVPMISARRTDLEEVRPMLAAIGEAAGRSREQRLLALFAGVFDAIDRERARVIDGIGRFARKQRELAAQVDARDAALREAVAQAAPGDHDAADRIEEMRDQLAWEIRIFQDRQRSLTFVCESPVILEKRAFALAQMIQAELGRD